MPFAANGKASAALQLEDIPINIEMYRWVRRPYGPLLEYYTYKQNPLWSLESRLYHMLDHQVGHLLSPSIFVHWCLPHKQKWSRHQMQYLHLQKSHKSTGFTADYVWYTTTMLPVTQLICNSH